MSAKVINHIIGAALVLLGFILAVCWDEYKHNRDIMQVENDVLAAFGQEMSEDIIVIDFNITALNTELGILKDNKCIVGPLYRLKNSIGNWSIINPRMRFVKENKILGRIRTLFSHMSEINELLSSREMYRINNAALSDIRQGLQKYDELLLEKLSTLKGEINSIEEVLKSAIFLDQLRT